MWVDRVAQPTVENFSIDSDVVDTATVFEEHYHGRDQLAWMGGGAVSVGVAGQRWHMRRDHFVWVPAGMLHQMSFTEPGELISVYTDVRLRPAGARWESPCVLTADTLAVNLLWHLLAQPRGLDRRRRCLALLHDLLQEAELSHDIVALPRDPRSREVATRILENPADRRELSEWAAELGVSEKTLSRGFREAGVTFRYWRTNARLHAGAGLLVRGESVAAVAEQVGFATASGFVAAFSERFGTTPGRYARLRAQERLRSGQRR